jgi:hypothetical protein
MSNFTEKMQIFCQAKANGATSVNAALLAGYSASTAVKQGSRLMGRDDVRAEIARLKREAKKGEVEGQPDRRDPTKILKAKYDSPLDLMLDAMNTPALPFGLRFEAAKQALPYCNPKVEAKGKKDARKDAAHAVAGKGRFTPKAPPSRGATVTELQPRKRA